MDYIVQTEKQELLPLYVRGANIMHEQESVDRPDGYSNCQLTLCREGSGVFTDHTGNTHQIERGDIFFFADNVAHSYSAASKKWIVSYIVFNGDSVDRILEFFGLDKSFVVRRGDDKELSTVNLYFNRIYEYLFSTIDAKAARCSSLLYVLLVYISEMNKAVKNKENDVLSTRLAPVLNYIYRHMSEDISVAQLAEVMGVTESRLTHLFRQIYNLSPMQAVRKIKINRARSILRIYPNKKIREVAEECGFFSTEYFATVFKRELGMSPTEYRKIDDGIIPW